jgi:hypothetical protein
MISQRLLLSGGPLALMVLFLIRALIPSPDVTLLGIFVVLLAAVGAMTGGSRIGAGVVLLLALALFQPVTARDFSFNLGSVDEPLWRLWAVGSLLALGWTLVASVLVLIGEIDLERAIGGSAAGLVLGVGLLLLFPVLAPQPGFGADLTSEEIDELPVIEMLNYRYEPPIVSIQTDGVHRAKVVNESDLPHAITIDAIDLEVYVPAGRWAVIEIDGAELAAGQVELFCAIGDHKAQGMQALLEIE